jgi:hypothetical protein
MMRCSAGFKGSPREVEKTESHDALEIGVGRHQGEAALQRSGCDHCVDVADQAGLREAKLGPDIGIALHHSMRYEVGLYIAKQLSKLAAMLNVPWPSLEVLDDFSIDEDTRCGFSSLDPGVSIWMAVGRPNKYAASIVVSSK